NRFCTSKKLDKCAGFFGANDDFLECGDTSPLLGENGSSSLKFQSADMSAHSKMPADEMNVVRKFTRRFEVEDCIKQILAREAAASMSFVRLSVKFIAACENFCHAGQKSGALSR